MKLRNKNLFFNLLLMYSKNNLSYKKEINTEQTLKLLGVLKCYCKKSGLENSKKTVEEWEEKCKNNINKKELKSIKKSVVKIYEGVFGSL